MFGQRPASASLSNTSPRDPNELLQRIDQQTTMIFHWVRTGIIVVIILLVAIALGI